jgi:hypothetical protein
VKLLDPQKKQKTKTKSDITVSNIIGEEENGSVV